MNIKTTIYRLDHYLLFTIFSMLSFCLNGQNAPITIISSKVDAIPGEQVVIPVTVTGFNNIGSLYLNLEYDINQLEFVSGTQNPLLTGFCNINDIDKGNGIHRVIISWAGNGSPEGVTLPDSSSIVDYVFIFRSGPASLRWYNIGPYCEYADPFANVLNDTPASEYFINGVVSDAVLLKPTITANGSTTFFEGGSVKLTSSAGIEYLWSTGETTSSIVVNNPGTYTVQIKNVDGILSEPSEPIIVVLNSIENIGLHFRFSNPKVVNNIEENFLEFDVQVKADAKGTFLWNGLVSLNFDNVTLSANNNDWTITPDSIFNSNNSLENKKYSYISTVGESNIEIEIRGDPSSSNFTISSNDFVEIVDQYKTLAKIRGKIITKTGKAGISFNEGMMNGKQFYKLSTTPWNASYNETSSYNQQDLEDIYVGRIYSSNHWSQVVSFDWKKVVNTSIWDGNAVIPNDGISNALNLTVHEQANLTIPASGKMTVAGNTKIKSAGGLIVLSDVTGTGSLITATSSGSAKIQRYLNAESWHLISSPVSSQTISSFLAENTNVSSANNTNESHITDFNPISNEWNGWFSNLTDGKILSGTGYKVQARDNNGVQYNGTLQAGVLSIDVAENKWNCVGNPYSSAIKINTGMDISLDFLTANSNTLDPMFGAIYLWNQPDASNGFTESYTAVSNASDPKELQQGQAFFVKLNLETNHIKFAPGMQIHQPALDVKSANNENPSIKLFVSANATNSSTHLIFMNGMTEGLDPTYDAGLLKGNSDLCIYSRLLEDYDESFAIQALPKNIDSDMIIPVGLDFKTGGEVVFTAELLNIPEGWRVCLEDLSTGIFTELLEKEYVTRVDAGFSDYGRFKIHTFHVPTGLNDSNIDNIWSAFAIKNTKLILKGKVSSIADAMVYDVQGRLLLTHKLNPGNYNEFNLPNLKSGVYILHIRDNEKLKSIKISVTE